jgi:hypothetical protein
MLKRKNQDITSQDWIALIVKYAMKLVADENLQEQMNIPVNWTLLWTGSR